MLKFPRILVMIFSFLFLGLAGEIRNTHGQDQPPRCSDGEVQSVLNAFYPGIFAVDEFGLDENGVVFFSDVKPGGLGEGAASCQYRIFAGQVDHLPDSYRFCEHDPFLGGIVVSIDYNHPDAQAFLNEFFPDLRGSFRRKVDAFLSLFDFQVSLKRLTFFDENGIEHAVGSGAGGDPALIDPTAGEPVPQEMLLSATRNFFNGHPASSGEGSEKRLRLLAQRQWAFITSLEAGTYESLAFDFSGDEEFSFPPVTLVIVPCAY